MCLVVCCCLGADVADRMLISVPSRLHDECPEPYQPNFALLKDRSIPQALNRYHIELLE